MSLFFYYCCISTINNIKQKQFIIMTETKKTRVSKAHTVTFLTCLKYKIKKYL